jgi:predicted nucleic acid-binding protein
MKKYLVDANVILRFLMRDDGKLSDLADKIFSKIEKKKISAILSILTLHEVLYVATRGYGISREMIANSILKLLLLKNVDTLEINKEKVVEMLNCWKILNVDWPDIYLFTMSKEIGEVISFDKDFEKLKKY